MQRAVWKKKRKMVAVASTKGVNLNKLESPAFVGLFYLLANHIKFAYLIKD